ncbi:MAG: glycosyltransferase family 2 protein [Deltaproteobacteria bacterium]|nr:glycosyltransferase family 2 protein [Deltaproteobacteria bacterium]
MNPPATPFISVVIPNRNGGKTIGRCLDAAFASQYSNFEVIVVDDSSTDNSTSIIDRYPCRLIRLPEHGGASKARNTGAGNSRGEILFFIDADCLLQPDTLAKAAAAYLKNGAEVIIGGTYTCLPFDRNFFSIFQSIYIHYSETKNLQSPDYIATHAMLIRAEIFKKSGGFKEDFMPILEDVEFSHRLKRMGYRLRMDPGILVQHIFNFTLIKSLRNAIRKTKYWSIYSIKNKDLLSDSGTASQEFKFNVLSCFAVLVLLLIGLWLNNWAALLPILLLYGANLYLNRNLIRAFHKTGGPNFAISAVLYYTFLYPFAVGIGAFSAIFSQHFGFRL